MSIHDEIATESQNLDDILRERDMAKAYISITQEMGPCQQLIDFVNYSGSMTSDDGVALESMNMFDQHNLILSKLDPDALDAIAMESVKSVVKKVVGGILVVNAITSIGVFALPIIPLLLAGAGAVLIKSGMDDVAAPTVKYFTQLTAKFAADLKGVNGFASSMPSGLDQSAWESFSETSSKFAENDTEVKPEAVSFKTAGWDAAKTKNAIEWLKSNVSALEAADKKAGAKFKSLDSQMESNSEGASKVSKYVAGAVKNYSTVTMRASGTLEDIKHVIEKVAKHFEEKKK